MLTQGAVADYIKRAEQANLNWPIPSNLEERDLGLLLFPTQAVTGQRRFAEPDFLTCYSDLKSKTVTRIYCGKSIVSNTQKMAIAMHSFAIGSKNGKANKNAACARFILPVKNYL